MEQHTPSTHEPEAHCEPSVHTVPMRLFPGVVQVPLLQVSPSGQDAESQQKPMLEDDVGGTTQLPEAHC